MSAIYGTLKGYANSETVKQAVLGASVGAVMVGIGVTVGMLSPSPLDILISRFAPGAFIASAMVFAIHKAVPAVKEGAPREYKNISFTLGLAAATLLYSSYNFFPMVVNALAVGGAYMALKEDSAQIFLKVLRHPFATLSALKQNLNQTAEEKKKLVDALKAQKEGFEKEIARLVSRTENGKAITFLEGRIKQLEEQISIQAQNHRTIVDRMARQSQDAYEGKRESEGQVKELEGKLRRSETALAASEQNVEKLERSLQTKQEDFDAQNDDLTQELEQVKQERDMKLRALFNALERSNNTLVKDREYQGKLQVENLKLKEEIESLKENIDVRLKEEIKIRERTLQEIQSGIEGAHEGKEFVDAKIEECNDAIGQIKLANKGKAFAEIIATKESELQTQQKLLKQEIENQKLQVEGLKPEPMPKEAKKPAGSWLSKLTSKI